MSENTTNQQARTVTSEDHGKLDVRALVLLAVLLAAGFILTSPWARPSTASPAA